MKDQSFKELKRINVTEIEMFSIELLRSLFIDECLTRDNGRGSGLYKMRVTVYETRRSGSRSSVTPVLQ